MLFGYDKEHFITLPTPIQHLPAISAMTGCEFFIKRDDMTDLGMGGNKLRKLEYLLWDAKRQGATLLLTYGGAQTNHGRLTAAVAAKYGMKCAILCLDDHPEGINANILLDRIMGAEVWVKPSDGSDEGEQNKLFGQQVREHYEEQGEKVYEIPVGGSNTVGLRGYFECALEMKDQLAEMDLSPDYIACAAGSLGTYLGLFMGARYAGLSSKVLGVAISPFGEAKEKRLMEYYREACQEFGLLEDAKWEDFFIEKGYVGEGYNSVDERARRAIYTMGQKEAILLDPCYTGKAFGGLLDMTETGKIPKGSKVLFLHTGGTPALYNPKHRRAMEQELKEGLHLL